MRVAVDPLPGQSRTGLSDGRVVSSAVTAVPAPVALTSWELEVEDWQPGATATETVKPVRRVSLSALAPWAHRRGRGGDDARQPPAQVTPAVYAVDARQHDGLAGPVRLVPYAERRLR